MGGAAATAMREQNGAVFFNRAFEVLEVPLDLQLCHNRVIDKGLYQRRFAFNHFSGRGISPRRSRFTSPDHRPWIAVLSRGSSTDRLYRGSFATIGVDVFLRPAGVKAGWSVASPSGVLPR